MHQNLAFANVDEWLNYISRIHHQEMDFGLGRIQAVVQPLGWQRFTCPVVIVGGTNGKGSCVRFLESIYAAAGYRVGAYTSPHLMQFNERIRVANHMIDDTRLLAAFAAVEAARQAQHISLSFFEFTFLAALQIFQQAKLDVVVLEVGLGGRLDAVNIVDADVAVITTIDLDHTEILGPDRESIAREKAGIFRSGRPVVCGDPDPPASLRQSAAALGAPWYASGENFHFAVSSPAQQWQWQYDARHYQQLPVLTLKHQNAATSLMAVELLQNRLPVNESQLQQGLAQATLAGRFEKIPLSALVPASSTNHLIDFESVHPQSQLCGIQGSFCYLDVAHNPQGGRWLAEQWRQTPVRGQRIAILGMLADKDIAGTVHSLLDYVDSWYVATLAVPRGASAEQLQAVLTSAGADSCHLFTTVESALQAALAHASQEEDAILVFGSFYTVAAARQYLLRREL